MKYRREIDGLRAVAVIPVILFHAGNPFFSGGFVGVDIFFVISGYLITSLLIEELDGGNFSIARFYERRARRILPALFFVIVCSIPLAWFWMLPSQLIGFGQSVVAVIFFASNILFWREDSYFGAAAELKPMLHTWSLAVEEQYYIVFPLFLLLVWRFGRKKVFWILVSGFLGSLLLNEWALSEKSISSAAIFYLAPTRAWELLAGCLCAFVPEGRPIKSSDWLSRAGLAAIIFSIFYYDGSTPFPSLYALVPVVGTMLIILYARAGTWTAKLLSTSGLVGVGLISYSAYLWHQPLFAFARIRSIFMPTPWFMISLSALSLILAYFSWRFVETPFRKGPIPLLKGRRAVFGASAVTGAVLAGFGLYVSFAHGLESRFDERVLRLANGENDKSINQSCELYRVVPVPSHPIPACVTNNSSGKIDAIIMGDSHSLSIAHVLQKQLTRMNLGTYNISYANCIPLPGFQIVNSRDSTLCSKFVDSVIQFARESDVKTLILTGRFTVYWDGYGYDNGEGGVETDRHSYVDTIKSTNLNALPDDENRKARVLSAYAKRLYELAEQFNVVLVYPIPEAGWNVPQVATKKLLFDRVISDLSTSYDAYVARNRSVIKAFDSIESDRIYRVKPELIFCGKQSGRCLNTMDGVSLYSDDDHLNNAGAKLLTPAILAAVREARQTFH